MGDQFDRWRVVIGRLQAKIASGQLTMSQALGRFERWARCYGSRERGRDA